MSLTEKPYCYLGFGVALGESIKPLVEVDIVRACYTVGAVFIVAHILVDAIGAGDVMKVLDTLIFEMITSAIITTCVAINLMKLSDDLLTRWNAGSEIRDYVPTVLTLLVIIASTDPRDNIVNGLMDITYTKFVK